MTEIDHKLALLERKKKEIFIGGGDEAVSAQKSKGKNTARERINLLIDEGSFHEYDMFLRNRCSDFDFINKKIPGEGIVTGQATIDGRPIYVFSQDFTVMGGSLGEAHSDKMCSLMDKAVEYGVPIIGINDSGGARIQEGMGALNGYCKVFYKNTCTSGIVPQISVVMGPCAGGAAYSPSITDFVFMVEKTSLMFLTGPDVIKVVTGEEISTEKLGGAKLHNTTSGVAHFLAKSERQCMQMVKQLLSYLPSNCNEQPPVYDSGDDPKRMSRELSDIVPCEPRRSYNVKDIIKHTVDSGEFLEVHAHFAKNIVVGFARLNGRSVGIVANQPQFLAGCLDINASVKAARFVRFCDAFNIPLLTLVDVPGFLPGVTQEHSGIIRNGAKLLYAYAEATVPKITVVLRKDYGGAYSAMCGKALGADYVLALPTAEIAVMGPDAAVNIIYKKDLANHSNPEQFREDKIAEYKEMFTDPYKAAEWGVVNEVIDPAELRPCVISLFEQFKHKDPVAKFLKRKKHGNIPL